MSSQTPRFEIVIDTSVYRTDPQRKKLPFKAVRRLCEAGIARLHMPYIVEREFQTQQAELCRRDLENAVKSIKKVLRRGLPRTQGDLLSGLLSSLEEGAESVQEAAGQEFSEWVADLGGVQHRLTVEQSVAALDAYFEGRPPLKKPKNRDDIPDSFVFQQILEVYSECDNVVVIAGDNRLAEAARGLEGAEVFTSVGDFVENEVVRSCLLKLDMSELDVESEIGVIVGYIRDLEERHAFVESFLEGTEGDFLDGHVLHHSSIPGDFHEATVSAYGRISQISIDFDEMDYFGEGEFGLPISFLWKEVLASYYLFKGEFMDVVDRNISGLNEQNDHYYEVEEYFDLEVDAMLVLSVNLAKLVQEKPLSREDVNPVGIDWVDDVRVMVEEPDPKILNKEAERLRKLVGVV